MKTNQKIPEGWSIKKLGECFSFLRTSNYSRAETTDYGEVHYIHYGDIHTKYPLHISPKNIDIYVSTEQASKSDCLKTGDLILLDASEDYEGTTKCVELLNISDDEKVVSGLHTLALRDIFKNFINGFRAYITSIPFVKNNFWKQVTGIKVYGISKDNLKKIKIPVPPLPEQEKIAEILGAWDLAIEKLTALIEQKKLLKKGLMQRLLTGKQRLPGFSTPWKKVKLGELFSKSLLKNKEAKTLPILTNSAAQGIILQDEYFDREIVTKENISNYYCVENGDFIYNPRISKKAPAGPIKRNHFQEKGCISPLYTIFKINQENYASFYEMYFESNLWVYEAYKVANYGVRSDRMNITDEDFFDIKLPYPPLPEQKAIADILSKADEEIDLLTRKLSALKEQKTGLMQKLLTGQIRVKVA